MAEKLTIVIITRNQPLMLENILEECHLRLPIEVYDRIEVLIIDDHSDDDVQFENMKTISDFHSKTGLGRYDYLTDRRMPGGARNRGIQLAKGEYVWVVDGDDMPEWSTIDSILNVLDSSSWIPLLMLDYNSIGPDGSVEKVEFKGKRLASWQCGVMAWHKIIRRDLYGLFREGVLSEDVDWWMRQCLESEMDGYIAPGILGYNYYRLNPGSITATGADVTARNVRIISEIRKCYELAKIRKRPQGFLDHLNWLFHQYDEGKV